MSKRKHTIGIVEQDGPSGSPGGYRTWSFYLRYVERADSAAEVTPRIGTAEESYYLERARAVKFATGGTSYFRHPFFGDDVEIRLQEYRYEDTDRASWIAPRVQGPSLSAEALELMRFALKIFDGIGKDRVQISEILAALYAAGAVPVRYLSEISDYVAAEPLDPIAAGLEEPAQESTEAAA